MGCIRLLKVLAPVAAIAMIASGCNRSREAPDNPLAKVLIDAAPGGYKPVDGPASGPMDAQMAATATPADTSKKRDWLKRNGFQDGYSRVWTKGDDYITALAHEFSSNRGASGLVAYEEDQVGSKRGSQIFDVSAIPDAKGYILSGVKRKGLKPIFCQGIWFSAGTRAFNVNTCSPQPNSAELVQKLAEEQYTKARAA